MFPNLLLFWELLLTGYWFCLQKKNQFINIKLELCPDGNMYCLAAICLVLELNAEVHPPSSGSIWLYSKGLWGLYLIFFFFLYILGRFSIEITWLIPAEGVVRCKLKCLGFQQQIPNSNPDISNVEISLSFITGLNPDRGMPLGEICRHHLYNLHYLFANVIVHCLISQSLYFAFY